MLTNEELNYAIQDRRLDQDLKDFAKMILDQAEIMREIEKIAHEENNKHR